MQGTDRLPCCCAPGGGSLATVRCALGPLLLRRAPCAECRAPAASMSFEPFATGESQLRKEQLERPNWDQRVLSYMAIVGTAGRRSRLLAREPVYIARGFSPINKQARDHEVD